MTAKRFDRRDFVRAGILGSGAAVAGASADAATKPEEAPAKPKVRYRTLGRTKLKVSEVSFGSYGFTASQVFDAALNAGINFVLTAAPYQEGKAEQAIGEVLKKRRKEAVVMTGWDVPTNITKAKLLEELDKSLARLQTDHIDIMRAHNVREVEQIQNPAIFEAFEAAKKARKVKALGFSSHWMQNLDKMLAAAIDSGKYDVLMFKYNFMEPYKTHEIIKQAAKKKLGVCVFKLQAGKREKELPEFDVTGAALEQARARWALQNPDITTVIHAFNTFEDLNGGLEIMAKGFDSADAALLDRYRRAFEHEYCRYCGECEKNCPHGVAVSEVMRYHMYYKYYGREKDSMQLYERLDPTLRASTCDDCPGWCEKACPNGVRVQPQLAEAHDLLTFKA